ncbi:MAG: tRNA (adenine-N1)-methyltransferase [Candidatus Heimdallarchaeota archaeon]|nr:tRNA (adenine-N1)-methyltransferase [Candidatus Heimdallarchaeota archaeon]
MKIQEGDYVLISASAEKKWMVKVEKGKEFHTHRGSISLSDLIGLEFGSSITNNKDATFFLWKPFPNDYLDAITHSTQVIYQTDIAQIIFSAGIYNGSRVIEAGTGSGALTCVMAKYVQPTGKIYSYDWKEIHQQVARKNLEKLGFSDFVEFKIRDAAEGFDEIDVDAVILDLPTPWDIVLPARNALMGGGVLLIFVPTFSQVDLAIAAMLENNFYQIEAFEVIRRDLTTKIGAIRPVTRMIGFTAFLITGRKGFVEKK